MDESQKEKYLEVADILCAGERGLGFNIKVDDGQHRDDVVSMSEDGAWVKTWIWIDADELDIDFTSISDS